MLWVRCERLRRGSPSAAAPAATARVPCRVCCGRPTRSRRPSRERSTRKRRCGWRGSARRRSRRGWSSPFCFSGRWLGLSRLSGTWCCRVRVQARMGRTTRSVPTTRPRTHHPAASRSAGLQPVFACRLSFDSGALGVGVASRGRGSERPATRVGWSPAAGFRENARFRENGRARTPPPDLEKTRGTSASPSAPSARGVHPSAATPCPTRMNTREEMWGGNAMSDWVSKHEPLRRRTSRK